MGNKINDETINLEKKIIMPAFKDNYCAIACSSSNEYAPYLSVFLKSLVAHSNPEKNYDIVVFERNISTKNKLKLKKFIQKNNVSLRFINPMPFFEGISLNFGFHFKEECFFRLAAPKIFINYEKIAFFDIDLLFLEDVDKFYNIDVKEYPFASCYDFHAVSCVQFMDWFIKYQNKSLKLKNPNIYANTGAMIMNIEYLSQEKIITKMLEMANNSNFIYCEQDILNVLFNGKIKKVNLSWNYVNEQKYIKQEKIIEHIPKELKEEYNQARSCPFILHYAGKRKPWLFINEDKALTWWKYAFQTPFLYEIIMRLLNFYFVKSFYKIKLLYKVTRTV